MKEELTGEQQFALCTLAHETGSQDYEAGIPRAAVKSKNLMALEIFSTDVSSFHYLKMELIHRWYNGWDEAWQLNDMIGGLSHRRQGGNI